MRLVFREVGSAMEGGFERGQGRGSQTSVVTGSYPGGGISSEKAAGEDLELDVPSRKTNERLSVFLYLTAEKGERFKAYWLQVTSGFGVTPAAHSSSAGSNTLVQYSFDRSINSGSTPPRLSRQIRLTSSQSRSHSHPPDVDASSRVSQLRMKTG